MSILDEEILKWYLDNEFTLALIAGVIVFAMIIIGLRLVVF